LVRIRYFRRAYANTGSWSTGIFPADAHTCDSRSSPAFPPAISKWGQRSVKFHTLSLCIWARKCQLAVGCCKLAGGNRGTGGNVSAAGAKLLNSKFCVIYVLAREQMAFLYLYPRDTFAWQLWLQPQTCVPLSKKQISGRRAFSPVFWVRG